MNKGCAVVSCRQGLALERKLTSNATQLATAMDRRAAMWKAIGAIGRTRAHIMIVWAAKHTISVTRRPDAVDNVTATRNNTVWAER